MATKIRRLKDSNGDSIIPVTSAKAVIDEEGKNLDYLLDGKVGFKDTVEGEIIIDFPERLGNTVDLSYRDIFGRKKENRETANSYVINEPGDYCFPLVYGNGIKDGVTNTSSYTNLGGTYQADFVNYKGNAISSPYIEKDTGETAANVEILLSDEETGISNLSITSVFGETIKFIKFTVTSVPETGANYVVGVKDSSGNIMWSWHLWLWDQVNHPLEEVEIVNYSGNTYKILNYNLGTKLDSDLTHMKNWFYQWGRKDPMLLPGSYNSYNNHESFGSTSFSIITTPASSVSDTIKNPCTFYTRDTQNWQYNNNWVQLDHFYNYWDASCGSTGFTEKTITKTVYDPCPSGYSIPNARVFTGFTTTGNWGSYSSSQLNISGSWDSGWHFLTASGGNVFFPASGYRDSSNGGVDNLGGSGNYWSAGASNESSATHFYFSSGNVNPLGSSNRAYGFSVRPCAY